MPSKYAQDFIERSLKIIDIEGPVLDVGAADFAYWYAPYFKDLEYKTLDPDPAFKKVVDYSYDICCFPKSFLEKFGCVLMMDTLEHIANPLCAFKSAYKILKPGGYLILTTVASFMLHRHTEDYWRFLPDGLHHLCRSSSLSVLTCNLSKPDTDTTTHISLLAMKRKEPDALQSTKK